MMAAMVSFCLLGLRCSIEVGTRVVRLHNGCEAGRVFGRLSASYEATDCKLAGQWGEGILNPALVIGRGFCGATDLC